VISFVHAADLALEYFRTKIQPQHIEILRRYGRSYTADSELIFVETERHPNLWLFLYQSRSLARHGVDLNGTASALYVTDWGKVGPFQGSHDHSNNFEIPSPILADPIFQVNDKLDTLFVEIFSNFVFEDQAASLSPSFNLAPFET
jgi:hypothetical protein